MKIPFNKPFMTGRELQYIEQAHAQGHLAGDGQFTKLCNNWLEEKIGCDRALLTHSCTAALEIIAILLDLRPGDEVIMPSFTFVSTANAIALRGGVPVFVDIRPDTMNIDENLLEQAITPKTKAIMVVHYAGVGCEMDTIMQIAAQYDLFVIEDDAQGLGSRYKGQALGSFGQLSALSFHETKNIISGEGGALLINSQDFFERAEVIREKGTNRSKFFRGQIDKYTWVDIGSSYLPSDMLAAFLWAQMDQAESINQRRLDIWQTYHQAFESLERKGKIRRPVIPDECEHNAHMYYLLLPDMQARTEFINSLKNMNISAVFHYIPLHNSPMGLKVGRIGSEMNHTEDVSDRLVRLPLWLGLENHINLVINASIDALA